MLLGVDVEEGTETEFFDRVQTQGRLSLRVPASRSSQSQCRVYGYPKGHNAAVAKGQSDLAASSAHPPLQTSSVSKERSHFPAFFPRYPTQPQHSLVFGFARLLWPHAVRCLPFIPWSLLVSTMLWLIIASILLLIYCNWGLLALIITPDVSLSTSVNKFATVLRNKVPNDCKIAWKLFLLPDKIKEKNKRKSF